MPRKKKNLTQEEVPKIELELPEFDAELIHETYPKIYFRKNGYEICDSRKNNTSVLLKYENEKICTYNKTRKGIFSLVCDIGFYLYGYEVNHDRSDLNRIYEKLTKEGKIEILNLQEDEDEEE